MKRSKVWEVAPFKSWVSKSDIVEFLRCEYRVFIAHKLDKHPIDFVDSGFIKSIIEVGRAYEHSVISKLPLEEVESIDTVIHKEVLFRSAGIMENRELGIKGIIDLINVDKGKLYPIEIKSHKTVEESDRLELAFYWKLLQPLRKGKPMPKGYVLLNTGEMVEVTLGKEDFKILDDLIRRIRIVKELGTEPIICEECKNCTLRNDCLSEVQREGGLSLIHGIAYVRQGQLHELGIEDIHALAKADPLNLSSTWKKLSPFTPGINETKKMIIHARSWVELRPIYFGSDQLPINDKFIILDLEYDPVSVIWLVGILVVDNEDVKCYQYFADSKSMEKEILDKLIDLLDKYNNYQVLTWYGLGADLPQLATAWKRHRLPINKLDGLIGRHLDLYQLTLNSIRFPLKSFGLKEVGKHLGFVRKHEDINGLVALSMYDQYLALPKRNEAKRLEIKTKLLEYNREDLEATLFILKQLKGFAHTKVEN